MGDAIRRAYGDTVNDDVMRRIITIHRCSYTFGWSDLAAEFCLKDCVLYQVSGGVNLNDALRWENIDSREVRIGWSYAPEILWRLATHVVIHVRDEEAPAGHPGCAFHVPFIQWHLTIPQLKTGAKFVVRAQFMREVVMDQMRTEVVDVCIGEGTCMVRPVFSLNEVKKLGELAMEYVAPHIMRHGMQRVEVFYRNKPSTYFNDILDNHQGMMYPYGKDFNGDPGSPINGKILGLFFAGRLDPKTRKLPYSSPFGDMRLTIPAHRLINSGVNLYFGDFYCHNLHHYVTVVATMPSTNADSFCSAHLPRLNPQTNSFLRINHTLNAPPYSVVEIATNVWVELFYTGSVDIPFEITSGGGTLQPTRGVIGRGQSRVGGIVKNPFCNICNLYPPLKRPRDEEVEEMAKTPVKPLLEIPTNAQRRDPSRREPLKAKRRTEAAVSTATSAPVKTVTLGEADFTEDVPLPSDAAWFESNGVSKKEADEKSRNTAEAETIVVSDTSPPIPSQSSKMPPSSTNGKPPDATLDSAAVVISDEEVEDDGTSPTPGQHGRDKPAKIVLATDQKQPLSNTATEGKENINEKENVDSSGKNQLPSSSATANEKENIKDKDASDLEGHYGGLSDLDESIIGSPPMKRLKGSVATLTPKFQPNATLEPRGRILQPSQNSGNVSSGGSPILSKKPKMQPPPQMMKPALRPEHMASMKSETGVMLEPKAKGAILQPKPQLQVNPQSESRLQKLNSDEIIPKSELMARNEEEESSKKPVDVTSAGEPTQQKLTSKDTMPKPKSNSTPEKPSPEDNIPKTQTLQPEPQQDSPLDSNQQPSEQQPESMQQKANPDVAKPNSLQDSSKPPTEAMQQSQKHNDKPVYAPESISLKSEPESPKENSKPGQTITKQPDAINPKPLLEDIKQKPLPEDIKPKPLPDDIKPESQVEGITPTPHQDDITPNPQPENITGTPLTEGTKPNSQTTLFKPEPLPQDIKPTPRQEDIKAEQHSDDVRPKLKQEDIKTELGQENIKANPQPVDIKQNPHQEIIKPKSNSEDIKPSLRPEAITPSPQPTDHIKPNPQPKYIKVIAHEPSCQPKPKQTKPKPHQEDIQPKLQRNVINPNPQSTVHIKPEPKLTHIKPIPQPNFIKVIAHEKYRQQNPKQSQPNAQPIARLPNPKPPLTAPKQQPGSNESKPEDISTNPSPHKSLSQNEMTFQPIQVIHTPRKHGRVSPPVPDVTVSNLINLWERKASTTPDDSTGLPTSTANLRKESSLGRISNQATDNSQNQKVTRSDGQQVKSLDHNENALNVKHRSGSADVKRCLETNILSDGATKLNIGLGKNENNVISVVGGECSEKVKSDNENDSMNNQSELLKQMDDTMAILKGINDELDRENQ